MILGILLFCILSLSIAAASSQTDRLEAIRKLFDDGLWEQVVEAARAFGTSDASIDYCDGVALAQLGRWNEARDVLLAGQRLEPQDGRFAVELGGIAFKQKHYAEAARWLRHAMRLTPHDPYAADFLATVYFLQGNFEAALKYWNSIGKPRINSVQVEPRPQLDPVLLDRAFPFAPASTLLLPDFVTAQARVHSFGIFPAVSFRLDARGDGTFDTVLAAQERNGLGASKREALLSTLRGMAYETLNVEYFNLADSAINVTSLLRWDPQKRRLMSSVSGPIAGNPQRRFQIGLDFRDENWDVRAFQQSAPSLGGLKLRRGALGGEVSSVQNGSWSWSVGGEISHRAYRDVSEGPGLYPGLLLRGYELKQVARLNRELWRVPERRFESSVSFSSELATIWSAPPHSFERLQSSIDVRWFPRMSGDDSAIHQQIRAGNIFGQIPFDELFMLGAERDNDLWMRSHVGTRGGRKGSAPLGRRYLLSNWEIDKNLYQNGLFSVKLSPFLDIGKIKDSSSTLGSGKWLLDTGVQAKLRILGIGLVVICGRDLRSGNNAFYVSTSR